MSNGFNRSLAISCAILISGSLAVGDTLYLRSGATVQGSFAGGDTRQMKIIVGDHVETYNLGEVLRLELNGNGGPRGNSVNPTGDRVTRDSMDRDRMDRDRMDRDRPPAPPQPDTYNTPPPAPVNNGSYNNAYNGSGAEIPSGTNLVVRLIDGVDSDRDSMGKTFRASLDEPVVVNGQTVIQRGADVVVKLIDEKNSGKFTGRTSLTLDLMSVSINGRMVDVVTSDVTQASGSRTNRSAATVGGGAAVGAILGGIFGGGKGAAIGAASGGALGAGSQVVTKGQKVKIPSETRLSFLLQQPLRY